jgi:amino acid adenylation domain-containing protein
MFDPNSVPFPLAGEGQLFSDSVLDSSTLDSGIGDCLPLIRTDDRIKLQDLTEQLLVAEPFWAERLTNLQPLALPLSSLSNTPLGAKLGGDATAKREPSKLVASSAETHPDWQLPPDLHANLLYYRDSLNATLAKAIDSSITPLTITPLTITPLTITPLTITPLSLTDILQAAWLGYLGRLGGCEEFDLGWQGPSLHSLPQSHAINPWVPWRVKLTMDQPFSTWVIQVQRDQKVLNDNIGYGTDLPLRLAQEQQLSGAGMPSLSPSLPLGLGCCDRLPADPDMTPPLGEQLTLWVTPTGHLRWVLAKDVDRDGLTALQQRWLKFLSELVAHPEWPLKRLSLLFSEEEALVAHYAAGPAPALVEGDTDQLSIQALFEAQVRATPEAIALVDGDRQLTYAALNAQANQLAYHLQTLGLGPERFAAIFLERSIEAIVAMWAVLKAGGAYIPFDPAYPQERLTFMLEDAQPQVVITQAELAPRLPTPSVPCPVVVWETIQADLADAKVSNPPIKIRPDQLAYLIYTSGSTGLPKGTLIEQRALSNFVQGAIKTYGLQTGDRVLQFASLSFDAAVEEIYCSLCSGATLVLRTEAMMGSVPQFMQQCERLGITVLDLTTAYWHLLVAEWEADPTLSLPKTLRLVIIGGEAINPKRIVSWIKLTGDRIPLFNTYGPTETTVVALAKQVTPSGVLSGVSSGASCDTLANYSSIGNPLPNYHAYILDQWKQPVPPGWPGELHIGGPSVGRSYLNRPERTASHFWTNPALSEPEVLGTGVESGGWGFEAAARLYRTGDWVRYLANGEVEFLGRIDRQVKIRGFRIEPLEIEAAISHHPLVQTVVVQVYEPTPGNTRLAAYVVPLKKAVLPKGLLRQFLQMQLPDYMIPAVFISLEALPLTPNGKIDRCSLPNPTQFQTDALETDFLPPHPGFEQDLAQIWEAVLGLSSVGRQDHFFELGGDSLTAIRLFVQIERHFGKSLQLATLFQAPRLAQLAEILAGDDADLPATSLVPIKVSGQKPPLFFVNSISYARALGPHLNPDYPLYGLNIFGLTQELIDRVDTLSIPVLAEIFIRDLRSHQPQGPYFLTGYCDDAKLALEMAHQLNQQGETIALLGLIDPIWEKSQIPQLNWTSLRQFGLGYLVEKVRNRLRFTSYTLTLHLQHLWGQGHSSTSQSQTEIGQDVRILKAYEASCNAYVPSLYDGDILVVACEEMSLVEAPMLVQAAGKALRVERVPGYHHTLFQEPSIQALAEVLQEVIDHAMERAHADQTNPYRAEETAITRSFVLS